MSVSRSAMEVFTNYLKVPSKSSPEFIDITDEVSGFLKESGISGGILVVFSRHTTSAIVIQENEPLLLEDFKEMLENISENGHATGEWTLNTLDLRLEEEIHKNLMEDGFKADLFFRYNPSLQVFIDNASKLI